MNGSLGMSAWTSPNGEGSAHFATSIPGLERRVALWARANGIPAPPRVLGAVFARLQAPGSPFELEERVWCLLAYYPLRCCAHLSVSFALCPSHSVLR